MTSQRTSLKKELRAFIDEEKAEFLPTFFKAVPGGYGEGDRFLGIIVPNIKKVARDYRDLETSDIEKLLQSQWHEERHCALQILAHKFAKGDDAAKAKVYRLIKKHISQVNNWDLVDLVGTKIVGPFLWDDDRQQLYKWSRSRSLWRRRIAIISCFHFIKNQDYDDAIALCEAYLADPEDLIHKASGWMLREIAKQSPRTHKRFLANYVREMPRTMLRYSIEHLPSVERQKWLKKV